MRSILAKEPGILDLGEFLNPQRHTHHPTLGFWQLHDLASRDWAGEATDPDGLVATFGSYLSQLIDSHPGKTILGDLKYNHIGLVDALWRDVDRAPPPLRAFTERQAVVIHLTRRNVLEQLCSMRLAIQTNVWVARDGGKAKMRVENPTIRIDTEKLVEELKRIEFRVLAAQYWLGSYPRVVNLDYEALLAGDRLSPDVRERINALLPESLTLAAPAQTMKIAPPISELIENFEDVCATLRGTPYERYLETGAERADAKTVGPADTRVVTPPQPAPPIARRLKSTVLIASETGHGARDLLGLSHSADLWRKKDIAVAWAVQDLARAAAILGNHETIVQAPVWPPHRQFGGTGSSASYADVLARLGFGDPLKLAAMVSAWTELIERLEPALVIASGSPALQLALYETTVPVVACGSPFALPPLQYRHFPALRGGQQPMLSEARLLRVARQVQAARQAPRPAQLVPIFDSTARIVYGLPELDPYRASRTEPIAAPPGGLPGAQPWFSEKRLYAELDPEMPKADAVIQALAASGVPIEACFLGDPGPYAEFLEARGHVVHERPPPLDAVLARASHVLTTARPVVSAAALSAGRAQLLVPIDEEGWLVSHEIVRNEAGLRLDLKADTGVADEIDRFLADARLSESANELARRLAERTLPDAASTLGDEVTRLVS